MCYVNKYGFQCSQFWSSNFCLFLLLIFWIHGQQVEMKDKEILYSFALQHMINGNNGLLHWVILPQKWRTILKLHGSIDVNTVIIFASILAKWTHLHQDTHSCTIALLKWMLWLFDIQAACILNVCLRWLNKYQFYSKLWPFIVVALA